MSEEKKLIKHLLDNYKEVGNGGRPVLNITTVMEVEFGLGLIQMDLDERYKVLKMSMWSKYKWRDEYLQWDPSEYSGVKNVRVPSERIWLPDIMLYNSADPQSEFRDVLAVVLHDGSVSWVPHQIFKSSCSLDVTNFPFDNQNCHMWFGSWTHTRAEVDVKMAFDSGIDLSTFQSDYLESSDWNIQNTTAEKKIMPPGANDTASTYAVLTFEINMKRKLVFSSYILTLPCVFLACLTLVVFWLPPDRPDRTALAMSIFASFLVLLLILVEAAPPTASSVPVLGVYYCFNLVIIMVAVFLSALVVNVCRAGETKRKVPRWLKKLCIDWIGKVLFVPTMSQETADMASVFRNEGMQLDATPQQETRILDYTPEKLVRVAAQCNGTYRSTVEPAENSRLVEGQMKEMRKSLAHIKSNLVEKAVTEYNNSQCIKEWRDVSLVMDRVFFIVYIILIVVSLITLFPRPGR